MSEIRATEQTRRTRIMGVGGTTRMSLSIVNHPLKKYETRQQQVCGETQRAERTMRHSAQRDVSPSFDFSWSIPSDLSFDRSVMRLMPRRSAA